MDVSNFFEAATGLRPFPYQASLAQGPWPDLLDVPTGLGKTAAVITSWLYRRATDPSNTPRRLVYCLPMRTLVEQTESAARRYVAQTAEHFIAADLSAPTVHVLMGGDLDESWERHPESSAILIGTQDMLLSRALNRGYGMSRYKWPVHFGLLNTDCLWVFDETQLMGVGVETSAQLDGIRGRLGTLGRSQSLWMSATLGPGQIETVDHLEPEVGWSRLRLTEADRENSVVALRVGSRKPIDRAVDMRLISTSQKDLRDYAEGVANLVTGAHRAGTLTLVVVNRVDRARSIYRAIVGRAGRDVSNTSLIHSRFRRADRRVREGLLKADGDRVIVATQAIEAGVDVSAELMVTELAPWSSLVQRFGRCNRYGRQNDRARVVWLDLDEEGSRGEVALPYEPVALATARGLLTQLSDVSPSALAAVDYQAPSVIRPVIRTRDILGLFDTTSDLSGNDVDVSRYIRDSTDIDVQVYWRDFDLTVGGGPAGGRVLTKSGPEELCRVGIATFAGFQKALAKKRRSLATQGKAGVLQASRLHTWWWDPLAAVWIPARRPRPGRVYLLHSSAGGYEPELGWTGEVQDFSVAEVVGETTWSLSDESMSSDSASNVGAWVSLTDHLDEVRLQAQKRVQALSLSPRFVRAVCTAALWHDVGKAHPEFQKKLRDSAEAAGALPPPEPGGLYAKSNSYARVRTTRPYLRHELASALAYRAHRQGTDDAALVAYLIAAHHGKVRLSIRALPEEAKPEGLDRLYARGIWDGDLLPPVMLPDGTLLPETTLDLSSMRMGQGSWLEETLTLRDDSELGPFRLAFLEAVLRIADWHGSAVQADGGQYG